jgi:hypothetical protein
MVTSKHTGPMPTKGGDIVVECNDGTEPSFAIWHVVVDGQQKTRRDTVISTAKRRSVAHGLALTLARESRTVFFVIDTASGVWTKTTPAARPAHSRRVND